jgi:HEAT repeat protein
MPRFDKDVVRTLAKALLSRDLFVRRHAVTVLCELGPVAAPAARHLVWALRDHEEEIAANAARTLARIGAPALPCLIDALGHRFAAVRREAVWGLKGLGPQALPALPELIIALRDLDARVQLGAAQAIGAIGPEAAEAIPDLIAALRSNHLILCRLAAQALAKIGREAIPALHQTRNSGDHHARREALWALQQIRNKHAASKGIDAPPLNTVTQVIDFVPVAGPSHSATVLLPVEG